MQSPDAPLLFDSDFLAAYEQELAEVSVHEQAKAALQGVLTLKAEDGTTRSLQEVRQQAETFFANSWVQESESLLNTLATQYAQWCVAHGEGGGMDRLTQGGLLGDVYARGHEHDHTGHDHDEDDEDDEDESDTPKTAKSRKARKSGWWVVSLTQAKDA